MTKNGGEIEDKFLKEYRENWLPLLKTNGEFDAQKIENEFRDLLFVAAQVSEIYDVLSGGLVSKPMYYADTIISLHNDEVQKAYDNGYEDALEDYDILVMEKALEEVKSGNMNSFNTVEDLLKDLNED